MPKANPCAESRCGRCGVLSGNGYISQALVHQAYRIRQPRRWYRPDRATAEVAEVTAMRARLVGWKGWDERAVPKLLVDGFYIFDLRVCEQCYNAPVRAEIMLRRGQKTITLWSPETKGR